MLKIGVYTHSIFKVLTNFVRPLISNYAYFHIACFKKVKKLGSEVKTRTINAQRQEG